MTSQQEQLDAIQDIRNIMERSTRFISLSGLSGAFVGGLSLISVGLIYWLLDLNSTASSYYADIINTDAGLSADLLGLFVLVFGSVFVLSVMIVLLMAVYNAKRNGLMFWNSTAKRFLLNMAIPLATGGAYLGVLLYHGYVDLMLPSTLIFYGFALLNAGKYTFDDIRILGVLELLIGLAASLFVECGLILWALGFGVLNIVFGLRVYFKYEK